MATLLGGLLALGLLAGPAVPGPGVTESLKESVAPQAKLEVVAKVKECCGYPLGPSRGYKMTFYWLAWESEYANEPYDTEIYTKDGFPMGRYPRTFVFELKLEGSGILRDGRVINYDGECGYGVGICFRQMDPAEHPLGMGGQGRPLQPFRSVAVDPRFIPLGTPLYVRELVGVRMPDGSLHDGCVRADDTGGGIRRRELDFFVESYANYKFVSDNLWNDGGVTPLIEEPRCAYLRHGDPARDRTNDHTDWLALHQPRILHQGKSAPGGRVTKRPVLALRRAGGGAAAKAGGGGIRVQLEKKSKRAPAHRVGSG